MRSPGFLCAALVVVCLFPMRGSAQDDGGAEPPLEPYHKHHDTRHGHDHFYPDRGAIVRNLPAGAATVNYAGLSFRFQDGVWFEPRGPAFMVVSPPIGLIVPALPGFVTVLAHGGETYLYANDTYYRPRPDVGGYEVVNDPAETPPSDEGARARHAPRTSGAAAPAIPTSTAAAGNAGTDDDGPPPVVTPLPDATATPVSVAKQPTVNAAAAKSAVVPAVAPSANGAVTAAATGANAATPTAPATAAATGASAPAPAAAGGLTLAAAPTANGAAPPAASPRSDAPAPAVANPSTPAAAVEKPSAAAPVTKEPPAPLPAPAAANPPAPMPVPTLGNPPPAPATATATPPASATAASTGSAATSGPPKGAKVALTPRNGQSADQEARDRYECYRFAVTQTGFDPLRWNPAGNGAQEYNRAQIACLEARGYSVQ